MMIQPSNSSDFVPCFSIPKARNIAPNLGSAVREGSGTVFMSFRFVETCVELFKPFRSTDTGVAGGVSERADDVAVGPRADCLYHTNPV